ncbi:hypothetical protein BDP27DRAFT_1437321 [Rhodocollybia butyracea]|uniref:Uncharacterized protein n=1 Tax=Rhodocollybia butyracea TaxID=206335 RepID=A0A9P5P4X7_9AGAR|nr:hypothetical protein BDP27DRAFT_1437321 [Rhodocollybia butyracea]
MKAASDPVSHCSLYQVCGLASTAGFIELGLELSSSLTVTTAMASTRGLGDISVLLVYFRFSKVFCQDQSYVALRSTMVSFGSFSGSSTPKTSTTFQEKTIPNSTFDIPNSTFDIANVFINSLFNIDVSRPSGWINTDDLFLPYLVTLCH